MLVGGMVDDKVNNHPDAAHAGLAGELDEVTQRTEPGIHAVVIGDIVAIVAIGGGVERKEPDTADTDAREIVESSGQAREISDTVAVAVQVAFDVDRIDN